MYIKEIQIKNVRSIKELCWKIPEERAAGWHVFIGDNGSGKTSVLRSIVVALLGPDEAQGLLQDWKDWLRHGNKFGTIHLKITQNLTFDKLADTLDNTLESALLEIQEKLKIPEIEKSIHVQSFKQNATSEYSSMLESPKCAVGFALNNNQVSLVQTDKLGAKIFLESGLWGNTSGWFSASYGPFRRFTGGEQNQEAFNANPKLAAHLSLFRESFALTEVVEWLKELRFKELEGKPEGKLLPMLFDFINQDDFLPNGVRLTEVNSDGVTFVDGNECPVSLLDLSDGYRSILSLTLDLIRQLVNCYGSDALFDAEDRARIQLPGVVLIDEVDAHLHPTWQRKVGGWFREHFPRLQFIVTTHSPLVCQAADVGTIFQLTKPGTDEPGRMIEGIERDRLLYGNILDAYGTEAFGLVTRSEEGKKRLRRLAELNMRELRGSITKAERKEQETLRAALPTAASTTAESSGV